MFKKYKKVDVDSFIVESNAIEREYSTEALVDSQKAWKYLLTIKELNPQVVMNVHGFLMDRLNPEIAGTIRDCTVYIGRQVKPFISYTLLLDEIHAFCEDVKYSLSLGSLVKSDKTAEEYCKKAHIKFEDIHPFRDGNGRTGRLLMNWQRWMMGLPILIIHEGEEQFSYYEWFKENN